MIKDFQYVLDYYNNGETKVDSSSELYNVLINRIPSFLKNYLKREDYKIKASMGAGNKAEYPWVAIMNRNITETTQKGLYIVYLFKKDMTGFYISLNQGITNFENLYKSKKYEYAEKVANYFKSELDGISTFTSNEIHLNTVRGDLGYGYERTNVLSKYYSSHNLTEEVMLADLIELVTVYDLMVQHMDTRNYDKIIEDVLADDSQDSVSADEAIESIKKALDPDNKMPFGFIRELQEVIPKIDRTTRFTKITNPRTTKIDYIKKAYNDAQTGLLGEELVLSYEQNRLSDLGRSDLAEKVKHISVESDSYGYDIESYDVDKDGNAKKIYIEVKTTSSKMDTEFFISKNELEKSKILKKSYCLFRVYDANAEKPKFYKAYGEIEENFILDPVTYMARYKHPQII